MIAAASHESSKRLLYYFPIIHAASDMGGLEQTVRRLSVQHSGWRGWQHKNEIVLQMWREIELALDALELNYPKIRIYQDGFAYLWERNQHHTGIGNVGQPLITGWF